MFAQRHSSIVCLCSFILCLIFVLANCASKFSDADLSCETKNNAKIDEIMAKIMVIGEHGRKYPENKKQLKLFCEESSHILTYADQYKNKCFKDTLKQFGSLFIYSNRNTMKRFCAKNNKQVPQLLKAAKCVNRHMKRLNQCMAKMNDNFVGIKYADDKKKIPHICCEYVGLVECFSNEMANTDCKSEVSTFLDFLQSLMGNFMDSTCGEYSEDSDKCTKMGKPPKRKGNEKVPKSILYPLYDIINSLPQ